MALWIAWLMLAIVLAIVEILTLTFFLLWLGIGALLASITAMIWPNFISLQILVAIVVSFLLTFFAHPFVKKKFQGSKGYQDAIEQLEGQSGKVIETIPKGGIGIVKVNRETWSAQSAEEIQSGEEIIVLSRQSTVLYVSKKKG